MREQKPHNFNIHIDEASKILDAQCQSLHSSSNPVHSPTSATNSIGITETVLLAVTKHSHISIAHALLSSYHFVIFQFTSSNAATSCIHQIH